MKEYQKNLDDQILARIKKLLALAESSNEHEAALAAARAQELLDLHKLSLSEIDDKLFEAESPVGEDLLSADADVGRYRLTWIGWKQSLLAIVARMNGCTIIRTRAMRTRSVGDCIYLLPKPPWASRIPESKEWSKVIVIVGRESDRLVVEYLSTYLMREIERLAKRDFETVHDTSDYRGLKKWTTSFGYGASHTIRDRMYKERAETTDSHPQMRALVLRDETALNDYLDKTFPEMHHCRSQSRAQISTEALTRGRRAGEQIQWRDAVRPAKQSRLLGDGR